MTVNLQYNGIKITKPCSDVNCVKSVCIRSLPGPYYATFSVNMGTYSTSLHIQSKVCTRKKLQYIKGIKSSRKTLTPADKTSNFYKITKEKYEQLLHNSITKTYKKANSNVTKAINEQGKKLANKKNIHDRIQVNSKEECFITLKDHKPNFENNAMARLINPAKNEIGRINKVILENINKELRSKLQLQQWNNTTAVINWFKKIENKKKYKFMIFDIKDFYSSISKKLLDDSINFARQHVQIKREDFSIIQHARKSLLYNK